MTARRLLYPAIAAIGIAGLGTYAYVAQRLPRAPIEHDAAAGKVAPAGQAASATKPGAPPAVEIAKVTRLTLQENVIAVGTIRSNESVVIRPEVAGRISKLNFTDGQSIKKGQVLVVFESSINQAEVRQARAELDIAKSNFNRNAELERQKFISVRAKDESAANVQVLDAKLALAQAKLSKLAILAPFSGIVGIRTVSVGDYVKDGADLVNLEDISSVKVDFRVPEKYADLVKKGQPVEISLDALPKKLFRAQVDAIDPQIDNAGRSALLRGRIANPQGNLKPGMFARVTLTLAEREHALVLPEEAIVPQGAKSIVWKVTDGKATRIEVTTGLRRNATVEIVQGLQLGDTVVTAGQLRLSKNDTAVRIVQAAAARDVGEKQSSAAPDKAAASSTATARN